MVCGADRVDRVRDSNQEVSLVFSTSLEHDGFPGQFGLGFHVSLPGWVASPFGPSLGVLWGGLSKSEQPQLLTGGPVGLSEKGFVLA